MIKKFIDRVFRKKRQSAAHIYKRDAHGINRDELSQGALCVCTGLQDEGFKAFVVGGAVRDLLLGQHPKDFDIATDATPEQVRSIFRRARIIGRRFRLVHVMFGPETVEVSTFRAHHTAPDLNEDHAQSDEHGRLLRDNVFGSMEEDALRRDFTVNALFYDPENEEVWDYTDGFTDLKKKRLVMIGDPARRYREDPVRMLRAARLAAKLEFTIDGPTLKPIAELSPLLENVPAARLFDEMLKLLLSGHAHAGLEKLRTLGLHRGLLPVLDRLMENTEAKRFAMLTLHRTDERIAQDKGVSPAFLFAALFWHDVKIEARQFESTGLAPIPALHQAMEDVLEKHRRSLAIPRRYDTQIKEIWAAQPCFLQRSRAKAFRTLAHPRFRACYDFFVLRAEAGDALQDVADWWERFQLADEETREAMLLPDEAPRKKKKRRRKKSAASAVPSSKDDISSNVETAS